MRAQPLHEICPGEPGAFPAALGFALALASSWTGAAGVFWAAEEAVLAEDGAPYPPGLAQFGLDPAKLMLIRAAKREDALWAAEQALSAPGAVALCSLGACGRPLDLKATRRLLLFAERHRSHCLLVRTQGEASAAWTRWRIRPGPSAAAARELGRPAFHAELVRNRAGAAGRSFILEWNAHACGFDQQTTLAGALPAAALDGSSDPVRARA
ncbi:MAG: ImuA family protein [Hyphomonadaceae bacterium]